MEKFDIKKYEENKIIKILNNVNYYQINFHNLGFDYLFSYKISGDCEPELKTFQKYNIKQGIIELITTYNVDLYVYCKRNKSYIKNDKPALSFNKPCYI